MEYFLKFLAGIPTWENIFIFGFGFSAIVIRYYLSYRSQRYQETKLGERRNSIEQKVTEEPANPKLAWDLARVTLEQYFYRNLRQVSQIFVTAICVMLGGFVLILYGAWIAIHLPGSNDLPSKLTVLSGVITEFIAATFMLIYRSTLQQANTYMAILEKINAVGMAVQIIESIPSSDPLYTQTRAAMAKTLLESFKSLHTESSPAPRTQRRKKTVSR